MFWTLSRIYSRAYGVVKDRTGRNLRGLGFLLRRLRHDRVFEARGLRWFPQLYKHDGGVHDYENPELLVPLIGKRPSPREANIAPSYRGLTCWAGVDYFVVDKNGDAFACRTAKRFGEGALGNIFDGSLALHAEPAPCSYDICPCTVPANRGMIEGVA